MTCRSRKPGFFRTRPLPLSCCAQPAELSARSGLLSAESSASGLPARKDSCRRRVHRAAIAAGGSPARDDLQAPLTAVGQTRSAFIFNARQIENLEQLESKFAMFAFVALEAGQTKDGIEKFCCECR